MLLSRSLTSLRLVGFQNILYCLLFRLPFNKYASKISLNMYTKERKLVKNNTVLLKMQLKWLFIVEPI